jgi:hypothetical protein
VQHARTSLKRLRQRLETCLALKPRKPRVFLCERIGLNTADVSWPPADNLKTFFVSEVKMKLAVICIKKQDPPRTNAEVKKTWIYTSTPLYAFME